MSKPLPVIEFYQHDWIPAFAAFLPNATTLHPEARAFCVLNIQSFAGLADDEQIPAAEMPYLLAESMMHEVIHVLEQWAGVEFNEARVEALLEKYRSASVDTRPKGEDAEQASCGSMGSAVPDRADVRKPHP